MRRVGLAIDEYVRLKLLGLGLSHVENDHWRYWKLSSKFQPVLLLLGCTVNFSVQRPCTSQSGTVSATASFCDPLVAVDGKFPRRHRRFSLLLLIFQSAMLAESRRDEAKARDAGAGTNPKTCLMCRVMSIHIAKY